ncbi:3888_t:CDS:1, partial [Scutellospora calospora]
NIKTVFINNGDVQISNPVFSELNIDSSTSISSQEGMIGFTDPVLLRDLNSIFTKKSDIYSLGMIMWSITSAKLPFQNFKNQTALINHILNNAREDPFDGTPQAFLNIYQRCWQLNSDERPTAKEVYFELERISQEMRPQLETIPQKVRPQLETIPQKVRSQHETVQQGVHSQLETIQQVNSQLETIPPKKPLKID